MPPEANSTDRLPRPSFVLPLQSTVTSYTHSLEGSTLTVCVSASFAAQLFFDGADPLEFIRREVEMRRLYIPQTRPEMEMRRLPLADNPEGMYGETLSVTCSWTAEKKEKAS